MINLAASDLVRAGPYGLRASSHRPLNMASYRRANGERRSLIQAVDSLRIASVGSSAEVKGVRFGPNTMHITKSMYQKDIARFVLPRDASFEPDERTDIGAGDASFRGEGSVSAEGHGAIKLCPIASDPDNQLVLVASELGANTTKLPEERSWIARQCGIAPEYRE